MVEWDKKPALKIEFDSTDFTEPVVHEENFFEEDDADIDFENLDDSKKD